MPTMKGSEIKSKRIELSLGFLESVERTMWDQFGKILKR